MAPELLEAVGKFIACPLLKAAVPPARDGEQEQAGLPAWPGALQSYWVPTAGSAEDVGPTACLSANAVTTESH